MNKAILTGRVGSVTIRSSQVATFSLATTRWRKRQDGSGFDPETTWHQCVAFGRHADTVDKRVSKGTHLTLAGRIQNSSYEKDSVRHYRSEIVVEELNISPRAQAADAEEESEPSTPGEELPPEGVYDESPEYEETSA